jgi:hypothetical protein
LPHIFVLPEDDANRQLVNGFLVEIDAPRQIQRLEEAGGWRKVLEQFRSREVSGMEKYPDRLMVFLIDFDRKANRLAEVKGIIPAHLDERVFVLGAWIEPEDLRDDLGSFETIGRALAQDCRHNTNTTWGHEMLRHNAAELARLCERIQPILSA